MTDPIVPAFITGVRLCLSTGLSSGFKDAGGGMTFDGERKTTQPIMTEYEKLKKLFDEKYARALEFLNDLSTMDLYKLRSEWRRQFPLR